MQDITDLQKQIDDLKAIIAIILEWKFQKEMQQISFPLDKNSRDIINNP